MSRAIISPEAEADLADAWFYIADGSIAEADSFVHRVLQRCEWLAATPGAAAPGKTSDRAYEPSRSGII